MMEESWYYYYCYVITGNKNNMRHRCSIMYTYFFEPDFPFKGPKGMDHC